MTRHSNLVMLLCILDYTPKPTCIYANIASINLLSIAESIIESNAGNSHGYTNAGEKCHATVYVDANRFPFFFDQRLILGWFAAYIER